MKLRTDRELTERGGHGVARELRVMRSDAAVFWSKNSNSFVACPTDDGSIRIYSINGIGEIRWAVEDWNRDEESLAARAYFLEDK